MKSDRNKRLFSEVMGLAHRSRAKWLGSKVKKAAPEEKGEGSSGEPACDDCKGGDCIKHIKGEHGSALMAMLPKE